MRAGVCNKPPSVHWHHYTFLWTSFSRLLRVTFPLTSGAAAADTHTCMRSCILYALSLSRIDLNSLT